MIYLDTNIYIYAFCNNVDDQNQKAISQEILRKAVKEKKLVVSELILYEFAFVAKKLKEDEQSIVNNLKFLSKYKYDSSNISDVVINLLEKTLFLKTHLMFIMSVLVTIIIVMNWLLLIGVLNDLGIFL